MAYRIAGIDVHKRMLAVVIADVGVEGEYVFERRRFGTTPSELRALAEWFVAQEVEEAVIDGIDRAVLAAGMGRARTSLATETEGTRWGQLGGHTAFGPGTVESRGRWTEERLSRCRTFDEASGCSRAQVEFRSRR